MNHNPLAMRNSISRTVLLIFCVLSLNTAFLPAETVDSSSGRYYVSVPQGDGPMPVLVFLHGAGNNEDQGRRIFEPYTNRENMILVSPKGGSKRDSWMLSSGPSVRKRVEEVCTKYKSADKENIYLVGYSAGGSAAYTFGTVDSSFYKGMVVINAPVAPGSIAMGGKLPVYIIENEGDPNRPGAENARDYLKSAGYDVKYDMIPASQGGSSHAYFGQVTTPMIISWIKSKAKNTSTGDEENDNLNDNQNNNGNDDTTGDDNQETVPEADTQQNDTTGGNTGNGDEFDTINRNTDDNDGNNSTSVGDDESSEGNGNQNADRQNAETSDTGSNSETPQPEEEPVVNTMGIPVGGLTDQEIETLVKEWLNTVYKPSQSPPNSEQNWVLNDWGIWTSGNITHTGKIDGYGSITDFWLKTSHDCFAYIESRGSEMHPPVYNETTDSSGSTEDDGNSSLLEPANGSEPNLSDSSADNQDEESDDSDNQDTPDNSTDTDTGNLSNDPADDSTSANGNNNDSSSENIPDMAAAENNNTPERVNDRNVNLYVPSSYKTDDSKNWGLVIALSGVAGNTDYLKFKLASGCDKNKCIFAGLQAKNAGGSLYGFRWENDTAENITFIQDVIATIEKKYNLSSNRTFLIGFSNGAHFTGNNGSAFDKDFEGFIMCEGGAIINTSDKQILISGGGQTSFNSDNSGQKWLALCEGMGHFFPGPGIAQDRGVETDSAGHTINGTTMIQWLEQD